MTFTQILQDSLKRTSIQGVPRILTSERKKLKVLWALTVLIFFGICLYNCAKNILEYSSHDLVLVIEKQDVDSPKYRSRFPSAFLCNKNPFSSNHTKFAVNNAPTPKEYMEMVKGLPQCTNCTSDEDLIIQNLLSSRKGYYQHVGMEAASAVSHEQIVIQCLIIMKTPSATLTRPCEGYVEETPVVHPEYFNCFYFEPKIIKGHKIIGFVFILHIDNAFHLLDVFYNDYSFPGPSAGAVFSLIPQGHAPRIDERSINIAPGFETTLQFSIEETEYLSKPYNKHDCYDIKALDTDIWDSVDRHNYTRELCKEECERDSIARACHCDYIDFIKGPETYTGEYLKSIKYCADFKNETQEGCHTKLRCALKTLEEIRKSCDCCGSCKRQCESIFYKTEVALAGWPAPSRIGSFYQQFIKGTTLETEFKEFEPVYQAIGDGLGGTHSYTEKFTALKMITNNFARVSVYLDNWELTRFVERPKVTEAAFLAQIGGSLNLWIGASVMVLPEFIEMCLRFIMAVWRKLRKKRKESKEVDNTTTNPVGSKEVENLLPEEDCVT